MSEYDQRKEGWNSLITRMENAVEMIITRSTSASDEAREIVENMNIAVGIGNNSNPFDKIKAHQEKIDAIIHEPDVFNCIVYLWLKKIAISYQPNMSPVIYELALDDRYGSSLNTDLKGIVKSDIIEFIGHLKAHTQAKWDSGSLQKTSYQIEIDAKGESLERLKTAEVLLLQVLHSDRFTDEQKVEIIRRQINENPFEAIPILFDHMTNKGARINRTLVASALSQADFVSKLIKTNTDPKTIGDEVHYDFYNINVDSLMSFLLATDGLYLVLEDQVSLVLWLNDALKATGYSNEYFLYLLALKLDPSLFRNGLEIVKKDNFSSDRLVVDSDRLISFREVILAKKLRDQEVRRKQEQDSKVDQIDGRIETVQIPEALSSALGDSVDYARSAVEKSIAASTGSTQGIVLGLGYMRLGEYSGPYSPYNPELRPRAHIGLTYCRELLGLPIPQDERGKPDTTYGISFDSPPLKRDVPDYTQVERVAGYIDTPEGRWLREIASTLFLEFAEAKSYLQIKFERDERGQFVNEESKQRINGMISALDKCIAIIGTKTEADLPTDLPPSIRKIVDKNIYIQYKQILTNFLNWEWNYLRTTYNIEAYNPQYSETSVSNYLRNDAPSLDTCRDVEIIHYLIISHLALAKHVHVEKNGNRLEVKDAVSPAKGKRQVRRMQSALGACEVAHEKPQTRTVGVGDIDVISGPTGSGKSHYTDLMTNLAILANGGLPCCEVATVPEGGVDVMYLPTPGTSFEASLWGIQARTMAEFTKRLLSTDKRNILLLLDEMGRGTDTEQAQSIILAWITQMKMTCDQLGKTLTVSFVTHDTDVLYVMKSLAEKAGAEIGLDIKPKQLTPGDQQIIDGISEAYPMETMRNEGVPGGFVDLLENWLAATNFGIIPDKIEGTSMWEFERGEFLEGAATEESLRELGFDVNKIDDGVFGYITHRLNQIYSMDLVGPLARKYARDFAIRARRSRTSLDREKAQIHKMLDENKDEIEQIMRKFIDLFSSLDILSARQEPKIFVEGINNFLRVSSSPQFSQDCVRLFSLLGKSEELDKFLEATANVASQFGTLKEQIVTETFKAAFKACVDLKSDQITSSEFIVAIGRQDNPPKDVTEAIECVVSILMDTESIDSRDRLLVEIRKPKYWGIKMNGVGELIEAYSSRDVGQIKLTSGVPIREAHLSLFAGFGIVKDKFDLIKSIVDESSFVLTSVALINSINSDHNSGAVFAKRDGDLQLGSSPFAIQDGVNLATYHAMQKTRRKQTSATPLNYIRQSLAIPVGVTTDPRNIALEGPNEEGKTTLAQMVGQFFIWDHVLGMAPGKYNMSPDIRRMFVRLNPSVGDASQWASSFMNFSRELRRMSQELAANPGTFVIMDEPGAGAGHELEKVFVALFTYYLQQMNAAGAMFPTHARTAFDLASQAGVVVPTRVAVEKYIVTDYNSNAPPSNPHKSIRTHMQDCGVPKPFTDAMIGSGDDLGGLAKQFYDLIKLYNDSLERLE